MRRVGITERDSLGGTWPEGQRCFSDWPLVQGIMGRSKAAGEPKVSHVVLSRAAGNPRIEREVEFAAYFLPADCKAAGAIGDDRTVSAERDAVRRASLP